MQLVIAEAGARAPTVPVRTLRHAVELRPTREDQAGWDRFAQDCGATFRGAYRSALMWQLKFHFLFLLRRYDVILHKAGLEIKAGQFVVGFGLSKRVFGDTLQLLPEYRRLWSVVMQQILVTIGPGRYSYGSDWTTEPSRSSELKSIPEVVVLSERRLDLYAVDFSSYASWDAYHSALSKNARRNEMAATRAGNLTTVHRDSKIAYVTFFHLLILKSKMFYRKQIVTNIVRSALASLLRYNLLRPYIFVADTRNANRKRSIFCGLIFGQDTYYLEGASVEKPGGAAWQLLISMLRLAYDNSRGHGKCILGPDDGSESGNVAWENLRRQRLQCRARPFATSMIVFSYGLGAAPLKQGNASLRD